MEIATFVISIISVIIAIISLFTSLKSQHMQDRLNEIELKIKQYELAEKEQQIKPCVEARIYHYSKDKYKIKIWNSGSAIASNVNVVFQDSVKIILLDGKEKLPFEFLEPQKGFELNILGYNGAPKKLCIRTEWDDNANERHHKEQWCDL